MTLDSLSDGPVSDKGNVSDKGPISDKGNVSDKGPVSDKGNVSDKGPISGKRIIALLVGNSNSGKSSIFNAVTGAHQKVGNYPGVTIEKKTVLYHSSHGDIDFVDLPGAYGLSAYSEDEKVARDDLLKTLAPRRLGDSVAVAVNIVDATNLERGLYLTLQLKEMGVPLIVVLNMVDVALIKGMKINVARLSKRLGVPVIPTVGHKKKGMNWIPDEIFAAAKKGGKPLDPPIHYPAELEERIAKVTATLPVGTSSDEASSDVTFSDIISSEKTSFGSVSSNGINALFRRFIALKLLEKDAEIPAHFRTPGVERLLRHFDETRDGEPDEVAIATARFNHVSELYAETVSQLSSRGPSSTDRLDAVFLHRVFGIPIFLGMMFLVFYSTFTIGAVPMGWIENGFALLSNVIRSLWPADSDSLLLSLLTDGVIGGVGGVVSFLPNILILFLAISFLEDSGYMSRAAFLMDRFMNKLGLQGKSFIPMVIGFGCSVPAILSARMLENRRQRIATILVIPFMSCGAHFLIYILVIPAFFPPQYGGLILWLIYLIGILSAVIFAKFLRSTILKGEDADLILELPPWHWPTLTSVGFTALELGWLYLKKAGTVLLGVSVVLWALTAFPRLSEEEEARFDLMRASVTAKEADSPVTVTPGAPSDLYPDVSFAGLRTKKGATVSEADTAKTADAMTPAAERLNEIDHLEMEEALSQSCVGRFGRFLEPVLSTMGFDWKIGTALVGSIAAKEIFVTQMGIVCRVGKGEKNEDSLRAAMRMNYSPLIGLCVMIFAVLGSPCVATLVMIARETGSWRWAVAEFFFLSALAWGVTTLVYQIGRMLGWG